VLGGHDARRCLHQLGGTQDRPALEIDPADDTLGGRARNAYQIVGAGADVDLVVDAEIGELELFSTLGGRFALGLLLDFVDDRILRFFIGSALTLSVTSALTCVVASAPSSTLHSDLASVHGRASERGQQSTMTGYAEARAQSSRFEK
jgi:hypothetical protein